MTKGIADILNPDTDWHERIEKFLVTYQSLYNLPQIKNREEILPSFFNYCLRGKYFVVIALYNKERSFFIQRDFLKRDDHWELVGGWVQKGETFDHALDRIVQKETENIVVEAVPIALVKNHFSTAGGKELTHSGLAFLGRLRYDNIDSQKGVFTRDGNLSLNERDAKILELAKKLLTQKVIEPPLEEVDSDTHLGLVRYFHRYFIKPLFYYGSSKILQNAILRNAVSVDGAAVKTIVNVACGDDETILRLTRNAKLVVANDISRYSMRDLIEKSDRENIIFTNQNLLELAFKKMFDAVICKNVMHHMKNTDEIELMLEVLKNLGKRIIIMDIENPRKTFLARLWNNYYVKILKDHGGFFIDFSQFKKIMELYYHQARHIQCSTIRTIKGVYMLAVIDQ